MPSLEIFDWKWEVYQHKVQKDKYLQIINQTSKVIQNLEFMKWPESYFRVMIFPIQNKY